MRELFKEEVIQIVGEPRTELAHIRAVISNNYKKWFYQVLNDSSLKAKRRVLLQFSTREDEVCTFIKANPTAKTYAGQQAALGQDVVRVIVEGHGEVATIIDEILYWL